VNKRAVSKEIWQMGAGDIAEAIRAREITCTDAVRSHLLRIDEVNPLVNAVTVKLAERAFAMAELADKRLERGEHVGRLHGVPFTIKENIDLAGTATTSGMVAGKDAISPVDAPHIARLLKSGAIPIARTNLSEMAMRPHTSNQLHGTTLNPWSPALTCGGSSGGDAVAVATGMTPLGMGNDYGGSLRVPSQFCGVASIKPGLGRVASHSSLLPSDPALTMQLFFSNGPIARRVCDLRTGFYTMSGFDARDPWWAPAPFGNGHKPRPFRVALVKNAGIEPDTSSSAALDIAALYLADAGYIVEEAEPPSIMEGWKLFIELVAMELRTLFIPMVQPFMSKKIAKFLKYFCDMFPGGSLADYMNGFALRNSIAREWNFFFEKYPVIVGPVYSGAVPVVDFDIKSEESFFTFMANSKLVFMANLLGLPAVSLPVGMHKGLPVSVQIISGRFKEDTALDVAEDIEKFIEQKTPVTPGRI